MFSQTGFFPKGKIIHPNRGFLFPNNSLEHFPLVSEFNEKLFAIVKNLSDLVNHHQLRNEIDQLNTEYFSTLLAFEKEKPDQIKTVLFVLLMLAQAYIWENPEKPANKLPAVLAKNIYKLCKSQQRFPVLTYADYILSNWKLKNPDKKISLDNVEPLLTFTGTVDEAWFIKIHVVIEAACAPVLYAVSNAWSLAEGIKEGRFASNKHNENVFFAWLSKISPALREAIELLKRMKENCRPDYFWSMLRPLLHGWEQVKVKQQDGEEIGVRLEGVGTGDKIYSYKGMSGAQSSVIPALDAALGIEHEIDDMYKGLLMFQQYMPREHQLFIHLLHNNSIINMIKDSHSVDLHNTWEQAVKTLKLFRLAHFGLVERYIHKPAVSQGMSASQLIGTGGSSVTDYLGTRLDSTRVRARL